MTITVQRAPPAAEQLQLVRELRQSLVGGLQHAPPLLTPTSSAAANAAANGQRPTANGQRIGDAIWRHKGGAAAGAAGAAGGAAVGGSGARDGARAGARPATVAGPALRPKSVSTPTAPRTAGGGLNSTPNSARASGRDLGPNLGRPAGRPVHASPPSGGGGRGLVASPRAAYAGALIGAARADLERRRPSTADSGDGGGVSSSARLPATGGSSTSSPAASSSLPALPLPSSPSASPRQKQKRLPEQLWQSLTQNTAWAEAHAVLDQLEKEAVRELQLDPSPRMTSRLPRMASEDLLMASEDLLIASLIRCASCSSTSPAYSPSVLASSTSGLRPRRSAGVGSYAKLPRASPWGLRGPPPSGSAKGARRRPMARRSSSARSSRRRSSTTGDRSI